jgi:hypothetical protein
VRSWQHWVHKTQDENKRLRRPKGQSRIDIPEKLATQDEDKQTKNTTQYVLGCQFLWNINS